MERKVATMAMPRAQKKWKLLSEPHSDFDGNKVSAIQVFNAGDNLHLAKIASRGTLLVDTGACSSGCRRQAFQTAALDMEPVEDLHTLDDTPLKACEEIRPRLRLGDRHKEEAQATFQATGGTTDTILSLNKAFDMGASVL